MSSEKEKVARRYDRWSRWYDIFDLGGQGKQKRYSVGALELKPGNRVLDVGCGTGAILGLAAEGVSPGGRIIAVDISQSMVDVVNRRYKDKHGDVIWAEKGDVEALKYDSDSFDSILATFAITSFPDPGASLKEMMRVLKPGGRLVLLDTGRPVGGLKLLHYHMLKPVMRLAGHTRIERDGIMLARAAGLRLVGLKRFDYSLVYCAVFTK